MALPALGPAATALAGASSFMYLDALWRMGEDYKLARGIVKARIALALNNRRDRNSIYYVFDDAHRKRGDADCYVCDGVTYSWNQVALEVNRLAHWFLSQGIKRGETIALYMPNKPAYPIVWLACLAIDIVPAFINYNLTGQGLAHCINVAGPRLVLYDSDYASPIGEISSSLSEKNPGITFVRWCDRFNTGVGEKAQGGVDGEVRLDEAVLRQMSEKRIPDERRNGVTWQSPCCLIYTSGTTGLPKAALTLHGRCSTAFKVWTSLNEFDKKTRIYTPMPLYHSTAALLAVGVAWNAGATVVIGRKFSASSFWKDVRESRANVIQYVGEVLRYLLSVPPSIADKDHEVRLAYGNGCRPGARTLANQLFPPLSSQLILLVAQVWEKFRERFGVQVISEFFASSEGNGSLFNHNGNKFGAGAVGKEGMIVGTFQRNKQVLLRVDPLTEEPARGKDGLCIRAAVNEPGELVIQIDNTSPYQAFAGYHNNPEATNKKIMRDVLSKGDTYFRTGDLLRRDADGHWYFADRLGDTFRWKSENVSTSDVAAALGEVVKEANVYGVLVPSQDGRAGCAAIPKSAGPVDFVMLSKHVSKTLPKYAQPLFIRLVDALESTGTGKQLKVTLRNEGVDPDVVRDPVFWLHPDKKAYVPFTKEDWGLLKAGKVRL